MAHRLGEYFEVAEQAEFIQHQQQRMAMRRDRAAILELQFGRQAAHDLIDYQPRQRLSAGRGFPNGTTRYSDAGCT